MLMADEPILIKLYSTAVDVDIPYVWSCLDRPKDYKNQQSNSYNKHLKEVVPNGRFHTTLHRVQSTPELFTNLKHQNSLQQHRTLSCNRSIIYKPLLP